jgi:hypothetical protein
MFLKPEDAYDVKVCRVDQLRRSMIRVTGPGPELTRVKR